MLHQKREDDLTVFHFFCLFSVLSGLSNSTLVVCMYSVGCPGTGIFHKSWSKVNSNIPFTFNVLLVWKLLINSQ